jgi:hypothetical protein
VCVFTQYIDILSRGHSTYLPQIFKIALMMEAVRTSETSVDIILHGSTSQKTILNIVSYVNSTLIFRCSFNGHASSYTVWQTVVADFKPL